MFKFLHAYFYKVPFCIYGLWQPYGIPNEYKPLRDGLVLNRFYESRVGTNSIVNLLQDETYIYQYKVTYWHSMSGGDWITTNIEWNFRFYKRIKLPAK